MSAATVNQDSFPFHMPYTRISAQVSSPADGMHTPTIQNFLPPQSAGMNVKRVTLTSKKNWWLVEMNQEEETQPALVASSSFSSSEPVYQPPPAYNQYNHGVEENEHILDNTTSDSPFPSPIYKALRHPTSIFSFPTPTAYAAPPNPTDSLTPFAHGSASELFRCVVKKPDVIQLEINGEMNSNSSDVTIQFLAELRVYTTVARHRNICAFLGCLENVGMVLAYIEGRTLYDVLQERPPLSQKQKIDYHNQLLDGLSHLHSYQLSHGDLSLLNVQVTRKTNTIKLLDFGRSVSADSSFRSPDEEPVDPFPYLHRTRSSESNLPTVKVEQIHRGTRPFSAPEILRGECQDPLLADAYSFGMVIVCLDRCESVDVKPWDQRKDRLPTDLFNGCELFEGRARGYLRRWDDNRRRLFKEDIIHDADTETTSVADSLESYGLR